MLTLLVAIPILLAPDKAELSAKPGGKVSIEYSSPGWRDEFETMLRPGETWRLGANSATTLTAACGLVFDDVVIFPGEYNLGAAPKGGGRWDLVFHHDGIRFRGESAEGRAALEEVDVGKRDYSKRLDIELQRDKSAPKGEHLYLFRATFGPKRMEGRFLAPKARSTKAKAGSVRFELTWLERHDVARVAEQLDGAALPVASIAVKGQDRADPGPARRRRDAHAGVRPVRRVARRSEHRRTTGRAAEAGEGGRGRGRERGQRPARDPGGHHVVSLHAATRRVRRVAASSLTWEEPRDSPARPILIASTPCSPTGTSARPSAEARKARRRARRDQGCPAGPTQPGPKPAAPRRPRRDREHRIRAARVGRGHPSVH